MAFWPDFATAWAIGIAGFAGLWLVSLRRRDASLVDFWWGPGLGAVALVAWTGAGMPAGAHALLLLGTMAIWALRLGIQLGLRRLREGGEDPRYTALRRHWDPGFWWKSLFIVFLLQGLLQGLIAMGPVMAMAAPPQPIGALALAGAAIWLAGMTLETVADVQLDLYRARSGHGGLLDTGLRRFVRYPNYLGEILVWTGISAIALSAGIWWAPVSAVLVFLLLWRVSGVPVLDEHMTATRPHFSDYARKVPALLPRRADAPGLARRGG